MISSVASQLVASHSPSLLLLVWLHGFKGGDDTFESFPERLTFLLSETWPNTKCTSIIYPAYDTRGSLSKASEVFLDWLTVKTTEHEASQTVTTSKGKGKASTERERAYVILLGHSMGGLVIADATLKLIRERETGTELKESPIIWPGIIGLVGYDTPYYGLNPTFFSNTANEYLTHLKTAQQVMSNLGLGAAIGMGADSLTSSSSKTSSNKDTSSPRETEKKNPKTSAPPPPPTTASSNWMKLGLAAVGVAGLAAAAGTTYWQKDKITENVGWVTSHLDYVKDLFETDRLNQRMSDIMNLQPVVNFHCFYTEIPKLDAKSNDRYFITLPTAKTQPRGIHTQFSANRNQQASNEINAHTTMFNQKLNSGYWTLGKESARLISGWLEESHQYRCSKSKPNQEEDGHGSDKEPSSSTYFTDQDVEYHDQLSQDAKGKLEHEIGDQMRKDEL